MILMVTSTLVPCKVEAAAAAEEELHCHSIIIACFPPLSVLSGLCCTVYNTAAVQYLSVPPYTLSLSYKRGPICSVFLMVLSKLVLLFESSTVQLRQFALSGVIEVKSSCLFIYAQLCVCVCSCLPFLSITTTTDHYFQQLVCLLKCVCVWSDDHYFCRMLPFLLFAHSVGTFFTLFCFLAFTGERLMSNINNTTHQLLLF